MYSLTRISSLAFILTVLILSTVSIFRTALIPPAVLDLVSTLMLGREYA